MSEFRPEVWSAEAREILRGGTVLHAFFADDEYSRQGHTQVTPYTDTELQARTEAVADWEKLTDELLDKGWLEDTYDGYFPATETELRQWVYDETTEEHKARVALLPKRPDTVHVPVYTKPLLNADSITLIRDAIQPSRDRHARVLLRCVENPAVS